MHINIAIILSCFILSSCSTNDGVEQRKEIEKNFCNFERSRVNTVTSHVDNRGGVVHGDIISRADASYDRVASVLASTKKDVITTTSEGMGYCCQWVGQGYFWCGYQYCRSQEDHDLRGAFGIGRAPDFDQAEELAIENCENAARQLASELNIRYSRRKFGCEVSRREWCY